MSHHRIRAACFETSEEHIYSGAHTRYGKGAAAAAAVHQQEQRRIKKLKQKIKFNYLLHVYNIITDI